MADNVDIANELVDRNLEVILKAIDKAIDKPVATNECEECGELIPEQRRQAVPWASRTSSSPAPSCAKPSRTCASTTPPRCSAATRSCLMPTRCGA